MHYSNNIQVLSVAIVQLPLRDNMYGVPWDLVSAMGWIILLPIIIFVAVFEKQIMDGIKKEGLPDVVFHSLRHTSVTYKLKLSGGDIKAVQGDSGHAQADMVTEVYGHILDEDRKKNAQLMENAFYNKENLNPDIHGASGIQNNNNNNMISVPEGVDADMLMKVLGNPEMAALLTSLAKSMKG